MPNLVKVGNLSALLCFDSIYIMLTSSNDGGEMGEFCVPITFL